MDNKLVAVQEEVKRLEGRLQVCQISTHTCMTAQTVNCSLMECHNGHAVSLD